MSDAYREERARVMGILGEVTAGGIILQIEHIGASSVPGLPASPSIEIGLAVWPFPLEPARKAAIMASGYQPIPGYEEAPEQRFSRSDPSLQYQLQIVSPENWRWYDWIVVRDYLRNNATARNQLVDSAQYESMQSRSFSDLLAPARTWWVNHHGFAPIEYVAVELQGYEHAWYISGGWALDLFLGHPTRVHQDNDVVIPRTDQLDLQQHMTARGWKFVSPFQGVLSPWPMHMRLELPRHQAHAHRDGAFIDFLLTDIEHDVWRYRRDPSIVQAAGRIGLCSASGIPYLAPEMVLLFKSKNTSATDRSKDQDDFEQVLPQLPAERRAWLRWALLATAPEHPWIARL